MYPGVNCNLELGRVIGIRTRQYSDETVSGRDGIRTRQQAGILREGGGTQGQEEGGTHVFYSSVKLGNSTEPIPGRK